MSSVGCPACWLFVGERWLFLPGPRSSEAPIYNEIAAQLQRIGKDPGLAGNAEVTASMCPETGRNNDGRYSCDKGCTTVDGCIHAWNASSQGSWNTRYLFVEDNQKTVAHETGHFTIIREAGAYGHPSHVTIDGKKYKVATDICGGVRWPKRVLWKAAFWSPDPEPEDVYFWDDEFCPTMRLNEDGEAVEITE